MKELCFLDRAYGVAATELYSQVPWQWFFTGSAGYGITVDTLEAIFKKWRSKVAITGSLQVATMGVIVPKGHNHLHAMLAGQDATGRTLEDIAEWIPEFENDWKRLAKNSAKIVPVRDAGAVSYIVDDNLTYKANVRELIPINTKLMRKLSAKLRRTEQNVQ